VAETGEKIRDKDWSYMGLVYQCKLVWKNSDLIYVFKRAF
jgi:hypothetical protein